jgi:DNA-3-methyladenine glycosylase I
MKNIKRCAWVSNDPIYIHYHDHEWGVPVFDDRLLFEFLNLEGAQAGLSWITVLKKRENYRLLFDNFDAEKISLYNAKKIEQLLKNPGIIRNRLKIEATISNAKAFLNILEEWDSFSDYIWHFVDGNPVQNHREPFNKIPAQTTVSENMSKDMKKKGFKFVGSTICYAFMQAVGMVNDHTTDCFRYRQL